MVFSYFPVGCNCILIKEPSFHFKLQFRFFLLLFPAPTLWPAASTAAPPSRASSGASSSRRARCGRSPPLAPPSVLASANQRAANWRWSRLIGRCWRVTPRPACWALTGPDGDLRRNWRRNVSAFTQTALSVWICARKRLFGMRTSNTGFDRVKTKIFQLFSKRDTETKKVKPILVSGSKMLDRL